MPNTLFGPRSANIFRSSGSVCLNKVVYALTWALLLCGPATQRACAAAGLGGPVGTTSPTQTATLTLVSSGTLSSIAVSTQGVQNLDFKVVSGGTCATGTTYLAGQSCTVNFSFTPTHPGPRYGAVTLTASSGTVLATYFMQGTGIGPQVNFLPGKLVAIPVSNLVSPSAIAVDAAGNLYIAEAVAPRSRLNAVIKETPNGSGGYVQSTIATGLNYPVGVAVDGAGNVYIADRDDMQVIKETLSNGRYLRSVAFSRIGNITGVAVDGAGNVYIPNVGIPSVSYGLMKATLTSGRYVLSAVSGSPAVGYGIAVDSVGVVYLGDGAMYLPQPDGSYARGTFPGGQMSVAVDGNGNIFGAQTTGPGLYKDTLSDGVYSQSTVASGTNGIGVVAVDGDGNVFFADGAASTIWKLDLVNPPALHFATTNPGSTSSPQTVTIANNGNTPLTFAVPGSGTNPSITSGFSISNASTCPQASPSASSAILAPNTSCTEIISFSPLLSGPYNGNLTSTDDNLNVSGAFQVVPLDGGGTTVPMVTGISPNSGPIAGGTVVTITGSGFTGATSVNFGAMSAASFTVNSDTLITATAPASTGTVDVTVTTPTGTSANSTADVFTYIAPLPQTITFPQPPAGYAGTAVLLSATAGQSSSPVVFSVISGPATATGANGSTLTYTGAGTVVVEADQAGDAMYAAMPVRQTVTVTVLTEPVGTASPLVTTLMTFTTSGTLGGIASGVAADFQIGTGGSCTLSTTYAAGQTCTVQFTFTPKLPGMRYGGLLLEEETTGIALADSHIYGTGTGPLVNYSAATQSVLANNITRAVGVAVDGAGNLFFGSEFRGLFSVDQTGTVRTINGSFQNPTGIAVDGSGNVFVTDYLSNTVSELLAPGLTTVVSLGTGWKSPAEIAVDGNGNVFVADDGNNRVVELTAASGYAQMVTLVGTYNQPAGVAVDGSGNVFVIDTADGKLQELSPSNNYTTATTLRSGLSFPFGLAIDANENLYTTTQATGVLLELTSASGYNTINNIGTGTFTFGEVAVDGTGNVYGTDINANSLVKLDYVDPPTLTFATTNVGSTSSDSPKSVTLVNAGNMPLTFAVPGSGTNPSITLGFKISTATCPPLSPSSSPATVPPGLSCTYGVSFSPLLPGTYSGKLTATDDNLNVSGATQIVPLNGTGNAIPVVTGISPTSGPFAGGTVVTITGSGLLGATSVSFGATSATSFTVNSDTSITATAPAGTGSVDVTVTGPGGTSATSAADLYTYIALPQTINFTQPPAAYAGTAVLLSATGGPSSSAVVFSVISGPATATGANGSTLTYTGAGTVVVEADQAGDATYAAASPVQQTITSTILTEPLKATSAAVPTLVTFSTAGTLSAITGFTQGKPNGDFKIVPGGNCAIGTAYAAGQTCTVDFTLFPAHPGTRYGAILLTDASGGTLASTYMYGIGTGPQVNFSPATQTSINTNVDRPAGVVFDGSGNLFVSSTSTGLLELTAASGYTSVINLNNSFTDPLGIAIDGIGNLFVTDRLGNTVTELFASTGYTTTRAIGSGWAAPVGIAIDGNGNLFIADRDNLAVRELTVASNYTQSIKLPGTYNQPSGVALDSLGNLFVVDNGDGLLQELTSAGGYSSATTISSGYTSATGLDIDTNRNIYIANSTVSLLQELTAASGYTTLKTINSGLKIQNVAFDGTGNIFGADLADHSIVKFDFADAPALTFLPTYIGQTSTDSPQTVTLFNNGNADLGFPALSSGPNPSITPGFTIVSGSTCPQLSTSSSPVTLAPDMSCTYSISFSPLVSGPDNGHLIVTDNNLNNSGATQDIRLSGNGMLPPPTVISVSPSSGPLAGGTVVTITGTNFLGTTAVNFGATSASSFTVNSDTSITATAPAGAAAGAVDVTVTAPGGTSATSATDLYTYVAPLPQTINFTPPSAAYAGTAVLLSATGGGSSSPVVFSVISGPATATGTNGSTLTYTGAGTVVVEADQAGDVNYAAAAPVRQTVTVTILTEPVGTASVTVTTLMTFTAGGTLGGIAGGAAADFQTGSGGTCTPSKAYVAGQTCTAQFTFTPKLPGMRYGGLLLEDANGTVLADSHIYGIGVGPLVNYSPATPSVLAGSLGRVVGVAVDSAGNLFVGSESNGLLSISTVGTIKTINNSFVDPVGVAVDGSGNVFVTDYSSNTVSELLAPGLTTVVSLGSGWNAPAGIAVDRNGNLFVADHFNNRVVELTVSSGYTQMVTLGGTYSQPSGVAVDGSGNVFVVDFGDGQLKELSASNNYATAATQRSGLNFPSGIAIDANGNLYIATQSNGVLLELTAASGYNTLSNIGTGSSTFTSVAVDGMGNVYGADVRANGIVKLDYADPPTLHFATTNIGSTSTDSPQTVTLSNAGNAGLTFPSPTLGNNPSITAGFTIGGSSTCPQLSAGLPAVTNGPGMSCTNVVSFTPVSAGAVSGMLTSTDNNLNVANATQVIPLGGTGTAIPVVTSISPNSGSTAGGTVVTITGINFLGATAVNFGATAAASFTVNSDTSITATTPAGTGAVDVTVTAPGGTSATSAADLYTYVAPLPQTITFPQPAPAYAGTAVLLSATGGPSSSPVVFSVISGPATASGTNGSTLTYTGAGTVVVEADQAGDAIYAAAPPVQKTVISTILTEPLTATSAAVPTLVTFSNAGTLGAVTALTQGKPNGEFNIVPGGNCAIGTAYAAGQTCTIDFSFTPAHPGLRSGAVSLADASGATLANGYVYGTGNGPQVVWAPGTQSAIGAGIGSPVGAAVDGNGNIFLADMGNSTVEEILASNGSTRVVGSFPLPDDVAVDGSGNVFVISNRTTLSEILAVNGSVPANPVIRTLYTNFTALNGMKVDANGNVFVANSFSGGVASAVYEVLAVNGSIPANPTVVTIVSGIGGPTGVAIDVQGNVYVSDEDGNTVYEVMAVNGTIPANPVTRTLVTGFLEPTNVALDGAGNVFVPNFGDHTVKEILAVNGTIPANPTVLTLSTALGAPQGLAVDSAGNVLVADSAVTQLVKLDYADPPSLTFAATDVGSTSTDSPQTVTMINDGNADLVFAVPGAGTNPSITPGFTIGNSSTCPQLSAGSTTATLPAGASCTNVVSFTPIAGGPDSGKLISTDNNLNIPGSTQIVPLNGVGIAPPLLTLTATPNTAAFGTTVTLTVTATAVPPQTGTPTGTVQLFNNGASLGTFPLSAAGVATLATSTLPAGTDIITCAYSGDPNFAPATCNPVTVLITAAPSALTLTSSVNPSPALTPVTFTAHFSVNGQPAGAGNAITFSVVQLPGAAVLTLPATTDATGTATFTPAGFYPGTYSVSATFTATPNYQAASAGPITEVVNLNPTATTLTASPNPAEQNQTITFTATVTALTGTAPPNGTVTLLDGATVLGTASAAFGAGAFSIATFTISTLTPGIHVLSAVYTPLAGNSGLNIAGIPFGTSSGAVSFTASQSGGLSVTVTPRDFSLTANPASISIQTQHHATMQLTLTSTGGWTGPITLTCGTVPAWVTCELPASAVTLGADATLPVNLTIDTDQLLGFLASATPPSRPWELGRTALATLLPLTLLGFARRRKALRSLLMLASLAVFVSGVTGCGANLYPQHAAPGVYNIPVTATGTAVGATVPTTHTLNITLTVTP